MRDDGFRRKGRRELAAAAAASLLAAPVFVRAAPASSTFRSADGVAIHYLAEGSGPPVVLVHGWQSSAQATWQAPGTMGELARAYRVLAFDLPGYGGSDKPATEAAYGAAWSEDVGRLLDHLAIPRAHIVGYSLGGLVMLKFAVDHPDRVLSGTLVAMGYLEQGSSEQRRWAGMADLPSRGVAGLALAAAQVKALGLPVEILIGSNDEVIRQRYLEPLLAVRRDWPVVEIAGADHVSCLAKPQFRDELAGWLARNR